MTIKKILDKFQNEYACLLTEISKNNSIKIKTFYKAKVYV